MSEGRKDMMQFKENSEVVTSVGEKVGRIDRVVIDPNSKEIRHAGISVAQSRAGYVTGAQFSLLG
jgi:sporulation protein YlmC with PRC-barrel domain